MEPLAEKLTALYHGILERAVTAQDKFPLQDRQSLYSRDNLLAYLALREHNLEELQLELAEHGLSSLGRLESNVVTSLQQVLQRLGCPLAPTTLASPALRDARTLLAQRSRALLGRPREGRTTRIMVTLDAGDIQQSELLEQLLLSGMDIARINCAHDPMTEWRMLIHSLRQAEESLKARGQGMGRQCRILMDLGGPKIRTGPLALETSPLKLSVPKDARGRPIRMLVGYLDTEALQTRVIHSPGAPASFLMAITPQTDLEKLRLGDEFAFSDARDRRRVLLVTELINPTRARVGLNRTAYVQEGTVLRSTQGLTLEVGPVAPQPVELRVQGGDRLRLYRDPEHQGRPPSDSEPASVSCSLPEALKSVEVGHRVFIDDGKISAVVEHVHEEYLDLMVTSPSGRSRRIRSERGLNFPDSSLGLSALTAADRRDLAFVVKHANAVGLSFVHRPEDLHDLRDALRELGHPELGVVAKIETKEAIHRLGQLLLAGLDLPKFGVMIARGDLAVEVGFENLSIVQEDILCLCEAAHVPVIWATQVLESLAKTGLPARAEITDAAKGQRAECVMLNKGVHVLEAVRTLSELLSSEERHRIKKRQVFRDITVQHGIFDNVAPTPHRTA